MVLYGQVNRNKTGFRGQALLELMPVRFKSGLDLEIKIRIDPGLRH